MSKQLHKNFVDEQEKLLLKSNICFKVLKFPTPWFNYGNSFFT